ncbi:hypothetical protein HYZ97_04290 [Candidatus Pacearchaeota archaeon]|nr:hypothetical protein [Candidatus Pacearchaeota archaeon]
MRKPSLAALLSAGIIGLTGCNSFDVDPDAPFTPVYRALNSVGIRKDFVGRITEGKSIFTEPAREEIIVYAQPPVQQAPRETQEPQKPEYPSLSRAMLITDWIDRNTDYGLNPGELWIDHNENGIIDGDDEFRGFKIDWARTNPLRLYFSVFIPSESPLLNASIVYTIRKADTREVVIHYQDLNILKPSSNNRKVASFSSAFIQSLPAGMYTWEVGFTNVHTSFGESLARGPLRLH